MDGNLALVLNVSSETSVENRLFKLLRERERERSGFHVLNLQNKTKLSFIECIAGLQRWIWLSASDGASA